MFRYAGIFYLFYGLIFYRKQSCAEQIRKKIKIYPLAGHISLPVWILNAGSVPVLLKLYSVRENLTEFLVDIFLRLYNENGEVMGTRASPEQYNAVRNILPAAVYDTVSRIIKVESQSTKMKKTS